jgi:aminobenzoyl-glutamate utilization protein B
MLHQPKTALVAHIGSICLALCLVLGLLSYAPAMAADGQGGDVLATAIKYAEDHANLTEEIASALWGYAEIGLDEYKSYVKARSVLAEAGFEIIDSAADIPTCLVAQWGSGKPVIGIYEDIDALPGVGHACGHNLKTAAGIVAAMAMKHAMETHDIQGTIGP